jgi:hypothetical protein
LITGEYTCTGLTSNETAGMGKVNLKVIFVAKT